MTITRKTLERIKWALYLTIPVGVGYGLGSNQTTLEIIKRVFPNAASDPQGDHGRRLQTLEDAYREAILEQAVDAALADARRRNEGKAGSGPSGSSGGDDKQQQQKRGFWFRGGSSSSSSTPSDDASK